MTGRVNLRFSGSTVINFVVKSIALVETWPDSKFHAYWHCILLLSDFNDKKINNMDKLRKLLFWNLCIKDMLGP